MERIKAKLADESGNSVIEATFIVTMIVVFIFIIMLLGFVFYQNTVLQTIADRTSTSIARTHSYKHKDPVTGYIGSGNLADQGFVDSVYWVWGDNQSDKDEAKKMFEAYEKRLRLMKYTGELNPEIEIKKSPAVLFQDEIVVTAEVQYFVPFTKFFGVDDGKITVKATSRALCADVMGQDTYYRSLRSLVNVFGNTNLGGIIKDSGKIISNLLKAGGNLVETFKPT